jgi:hypothetical protein
MAMKTPITIVAPESSDRRLRRFRPVPTGGVGDAIVGNGVLVVVIVTSGRTRVVA